MRARMKKRPRARDAKSIAAAPRAPPVLEYKVIELASVDELAIERALNDWAAHGWRFDGLHFAMRESSRRPSMAFVVFTRESKGRPIADEPGNDADQARRRLERLAREEPPPAARSLPVSAVERLRQLAGM